MFENNLKHYRCQIEGMTQDKLAKLADITLRGYQKLEYGKARPRYDTLRKLAKALGVTEYDLYPETEREQSQKGRGR